MRGVALGDDVAVREATSEQAERQRRVHERLEGRRRREDRPAVARGRFLRVVVVVVVALDRADGEELREEAREDERESRDHPREVEPRPPSARRVRRRVQKSLVRAEAIARRRRRPRRTVERTPERFLTLERTLDRFPPLRTDTRTARRNALVRPPVENRLLLRLRQQRRPRGGGVAAEVAPHLRGDGARRGGVRPSAASTVVFSATVFSASSPPSSPPSSSASRHPAHATSHARRSILPRFPNGAGRPRTAETVGAKLICGKSRVASYVGGPRAKGAPSNSARRGRRRAASPSSPPRASRALLFRRRRAAALGWYANKNASVSSGVPPRGRPRASSRGRRKPTTSRRRTRRFAPSTRRRVERPRRSPRASAASPRTGRRARAPRGPRRGSVRSGRPTSRARRASRSGASARPRRRGRGP